MHLSDPFQGDQAIDSGCKLLGLEVGQSREIRAMLVLANLVKLLGVAIVCHSRGQKQSLARWGHWLQYSIPLYCGGLCPRMNGEHLRRGVPQPTTFRHLGRFAHG